MEDVEIREALVSDAHGIAVVHVATWQSAYQGIMPDTFLQELSVETRETGWIKLLENPDAKAHTFVAIKGEKVVGFIGVGADQSDGTSNSQGELFSIYVAPDFQGCRIGSNLMEKGIQALRFEGFTNAVLWVVEENQNTRNWYESRGWTRNQKVDQRSFGGKSIKSIGYELTI